MFKLMTAIKKLPETFGQFLSVLTTTATKMSGQTKKWALMIRRILFNYILFNKVKKIPNGF